MYGFFLINLHAYICNIYFLQYHVMFKPVIDELWELEAIQKFNKNSICPVPSPKTPHMIQTLAHCWCDADANASFSQGKLNPSYVVEVYIHPWDPSDKRNQQLFKVFDTTQNPPKFIIFGSHHDQWSASKKHTLILTRHLFFVSG